MPAPAPVSTTPAPFVAARPRCPRCGAALARLVADPPAVPTDDHGRGDDWYCGCCGLVAGGVVPAGAAPGGR